MNARTQSQSYAFKHTVQHTSVSCVKHGSGENRLCGELNAKHRKTLFAFGYTVIIAAVFSYNHFGICCGAAAAATDAAAV